MSARITVLGAGVSGLTSALLLSQHHPDWSITVVAKHMPGDSDVEYCSPWAGADYGPMNPVGSKAREYEKQTWRELERLARHVPEAGVHLQGSVEYIRETDLSPGKTVRDALAENEWLRDVVPDFRHLERHELPSGIDGGFYFRSVCINTPVYLSWLVGQNLKNGVVFRRGIISSISDALTLHHSGQTPHLVVNCTGLGSLTLGGVRDTHLFPVRGQVVVVRNESNNLMRSATGGPDQPANESIYVMTRAAGGGTVLGGCRQVGQWESTPDLDLAVRIMKRCVEVCPDLVGPGQGIEGLSVIRHAVGLRPERTGGVRVELQTHAVDDGRVSVVHNYGHGGYGYQSSYGCAQEVERLVMQGLGVDTTARL